MEHSYYAETDRVRIRPLCQSDIELLRQWRNDKGISTFLSEMPYITPEGQQAWYEKYRMDPDSLFFSVIDKENRKMVGSVALYSFRDHICEVGRIVIGDSSAHGRRIGYSSLLLAVAIAVKRLQVQEIRLDVHENNAAARKIYEQAGFEICGRHSFDKGGIELEMKIDENSFCKHNPELGNVTISEEVMRDNETLVRGAI